jgi:zinc protease
VELRNGIVLLARQNRHSLSVTLRGYLQVGSLVDPDPQLGLADFTASALMRGTQERDFASIYESLESIGASLGFNGGTHTTSFGGRALAADLGLLLVLLAESIRQPTFPEVQIEKLRAQLLTGLALRSQDTRDMAALAFDEMVYRDHPYGRAEEGHPETVSAIGVEDLRSFHQAHYGPAGMVIAIVGGVQLEEVVEQVRQALENWENPQQPAPPELPQWKALPEKCYRRVDIAGKSQSDLIIGTAGPPRSNPEFIPATVGNNIFGKFGLMGRIGDVVREQAGLAYYAYSGLAGGIGPGPWTVEAGVNPANEQKASDLIFKEISRFVEELVNEEELSDSQSNLIGSMPLSLESNGGVAQALLNMERHSLGLDYYRRYPALIQAVTREAIREAAAHYLDPERLAVAVAGPEIRAT